MRAVNYRAALLDASSLVDDASLDKYEFMRDAFLQRRYQQVHGNSGDDSEWVEVPASEPFIKPEPVVPMKSPAKAPKSAEAPAKATIPVPAEAVTPNVN